MKRTLLLLTIVSALGTSQTTAMPSKSAIAGLACLADAGVLVAKNIDVISDKVSGATEAVSNGIRCFKKWYKHPENKIAVLLGLVATGGFLLTSHKKKALALGGIIGAAYLLDRMFPNVHCCSECYNRDKTD